MKDDALEYASPIPQLDGEVYKHLYDELQAVAMSIGYDVIEDEHTVTGATAPSAGASSASALP